MTTTREEIRGWLNRGKKEGATHVIVACDTFDWEDFPIFVMPNEDVKKKALSYNKPSECLRLMEVYNLSMDWDAQLTQVRSFNY